MTMMFAVGMFVGVFVSVILMSFVDESREETWS